MYTEKAINTLQTLVLALGVGLAAYGTLRLLEGYKNDCPNMKSQGMEQLLRGADIAELSFHIPSILASTIA